MSEELPGNLSQLRDGDTAGPSSHTLERRKEKSLKLEAEQIELHALIEDLKVIQQHIATAPVAGKRAIPIVNQRIAAMRTELGAKIQSNRGEMAMLQRNR